MKQVSEKQFDKLCKTLAEKYYRQTNESRRKCFSWAENDLMKVYKVKDEVEKDNQLVFPAKDLYLLRDDRILDGQILKKGDT